MPKTFSPPLLARTEQVYPYYLKKACEVIGKYDETAHVLKLDAYNEAESLPINGGIAKNIQLKNITLLEYNQETIDKAKAKYPELDIRQGDIRKMPFSDDAFDVILDLSTLDHIPPDEIEVAIKEYYRVMKTDGRLLLIFWILEEEYKQEMKEWKPTNQYFFDLTQVLFILKKYFKKIESVKIRDGGPDAETFKVAALWQFLGEKK